MMKVDRLGLVALILGVGGVACAGLDNPTALADLELDVDFDIEAVRAETFEEVEIRVVVREGGAHLQMLESRMEIEHHASGVGRTVEMHPEGDGYAAHVTFFEPGEYHLQFHGTPEDHALSTEMGEQEIVVFRHHTDAHDIACQRDVPEPTLVRDVGNGRGAFVEAGIATRPLEV
ncbi:MAG: hypothetical protein ACE10G_12120, partial [Gemmatimonadales bacterium]